MKTLYLAGPITGCSYDGATDWRDYVAKNLPDWISPVSPMRGKEYLSEETSIASAYEDIPLSCQKGITCRDRHGVMNCDMMMVNLLGAEKVSIGSVMEMGWADMIRKPFVLIMEPGNMHDHPMVKETAGFIVDTLDSGINIAKAVLMVGV